MVLQNCWEEDMERPDPKEVTFTGTAVVTVTVVTETKEQIGRAGAKLVGDWDEDYDWELQGIRYHTNIVISMDPVPTKIEDI